MNDFNIYWWCTYGVLFVEIASIGKSQGDPSIASYPMEVFKEPQDFQKIKVKVGKKQSKKLLQRNKPWNDQVPYFGKI